MCSCSLGPPEWLLVPPPECKWEISGTWSKKYFRTCLDSLDKSGVQLPFALSRTSMWHQVFSLGGGPLWLSIDSCLITANSSWPIPATGMSRCFPGKLCILRLFVFCPYHYILGTPPHTNTRGFPTRQIWLQGCKVEGKGSVPILCPTRRTHHL